jgi:hypothetical protein
MFIIQQTSTVNCGTDNFRQGVVSTVCPVLRIVLYLPRTGAATWRHIAMKMAVLQRLRLLFFPPPQSYFLQLQGVSAQ